MSILQIIAQDGSMRRKILLIKGKGGLGNRILSAVCGLIYADLSGRTPVIDWRDGSYAPLGDNAYPLLFNTPIKSTCAEIDKAVCPVAPAIWTGYLKASTQDMINKFMPKAHSSPKAYRVFCVDLEDLNVPEDIAVYWSYLPKFRRLTKHIRRDPRFTGRSIPCIIKEYLDRYFTPNVRVRREVTRLTAQLGANPIGIHVRYTDRKIPLNSALSILRKRLMQVPDQPIFLATDNAHVQRKMKMEFANLYHINKHLPDNGERLHWPATDVAKLLEAENALIDMWVLSKCTRLIYSRQSTFSQTSVYLGNMARNQLDDVDRNSPKVLLKQLIQYYA